MSVSVVLNADTLVITLYGALSPAETTLARTPAGAARMQEFHRQLFANSAGPLLEEIKNITGVEVREANAELESFARSVAHDLREPLRTMQGFSTALIQDYATGQVTKGLEAAPGLRQHQNLELVAL